MSKRKQNTGRKRVSLDPSKAQTPIPVGVASIAGDSLDKYAVAVRNFQYGEEPPLRAAKTMPEQVNNRSTKRRRNRDIRERGHLW